MSYKSAILIILLIASLGSSGYLYNEKLQLEAEILSLNTVVEGKNVENDNLRSTYEDLMTRYESLEADYGSLQGNYGVLQNSYSYLEGVYLLLQYNYSSLQKDYGSLSGDYGALQYAYEFEQDLRIESNLTSFYDLVRYDRGLDGTRISRLAKNMVDFSVKLAKHDLGYPTWPEQEQDFLEITGKHSYEVALDFLLTALSGMNIGEMDTPSEKIEKILDFIVDHVTYNFEVGNVYRSPVETLSIGSGDCDDYSTLAAALFKAVGIDVAVGYFDSKNDHSAHNMVLVHLNELNISDPYFEQPYFYFDDLTSKGLRSGRWIEIEPQRRIEFQGDEEWMKRWDLYVAAELRP